MGADTFFDDFSEGRDVHDARPEPARPNLVAAVSLTKNPESRRYRADGADHRRHPKTVRHYTPIDVQLDRLIPRSELARRLGVSLRHTYELEKQGLPRVLLGRCVRFDLRDVEELVTALKVLVDPSCDDATVSAFSPAKPVVKRRQNAHWLADALPEGCEREIAPRLAAQAETKIRRSRGGRP